jgi:hypothetical protein
MMNKKIAILAATAAALALAGPAEAGGLLKRLAQQAGEQALDALSSGELPDLPGSGGGGAGGGFQRYGDWEFKLDTLKLGPDEQWQAVIAVRNAARHRQGMVASEIKVSLIDQEGETLLNWGELYKASVEGPSAGLEPVNGTLWMEPGDRTRIRLRFDGSRGMRPAKIRIQSTGASAETRTFPVGS